LLLLLFSRSVYIFWVAAPHQKTKKYAGVKIC
jgi:hypothetical protein